MKVESPARCYRFGTSHLLRASWPSGPDAADGVQPLPAYIPLHLDGRLRQRNVASQ
jgi:hypothetical protein